MPVIADLARADWHRLNRLLEAALALDETARSDWLGHLPDADADLAPLLAKLLAATDRTETADFVPRPPPAAEEQSGQRIGPYRLVGPLGEGGMGAVWLAKRADGAFERQVALKLPHAEWIDRGLAQRFTRERAVLASLNHPNIAQLFDAGWSEAGRPYLALEYVNGEPLLAWCQTHRLDTAARLRQFVAVVRAVAHAHAHLVVHRDLKPSNVLVTAEGQVKLLDFGIAKLLDAGLASAEETELTRLVGRALTPSYAAPEQILGQPITTATDIYTLGVMLFELLTGERPYRLARTDVQSRGALEEAILRVDAMAPSEAAKEKAVRRALRGDLDAIVLKALKKRPEERYQTAAEFAEDIERHLDHRPVRAQRDKRAYRLRRFVVRNRVAVTAVSAVIVALVAGLAATLWQARAAREEAEHANTIKQFVLSIVQQADPHSSETTRAADLVLLSATEQRVARELATRPDLQLEVRLAIATAYRNRGDWERARQTLRTAVDDARGTLAPDSINLLTARIRLAEWPIVDSSNALQELDAVIAAAGVLGKPAIPALIDARLSRLRLKSTLKIGFDGKQPGREAAIEAQDVIALAERNFKPGHPTVIEAKLQLVNILAFGADRFTDALVIVEPTYREAKESALVGVSHPLTLSLQSMYGWILCAVGRNEEGLRLLRDSVELARKHHGSNSSTLSQALQALAIGTSRSGDFKQSIALRRETYSVVAATEPIGSLRRSAFAGLLGGNLLSAWRPQEALPLLEEAKLANEKLPEGAMRARRVWWQKRDSNVMLIMMGNSLRARQLAKELLSETEATLPSPNPYLVALARWDLVWAMRVEGDAEAAEPIAEKMAAQSREYSELDWDRPNFIGELAAVKMALGKWHEAMTLLDESTATTADSGSRFFHAFNAQNHLWRGQVLLRLQRSAEAQAEFQRIDAFWRDFDPEHPMAAEAAWWYGHSLIANGEVKRGKAMVANARPRLAASFLPHLRPLATAQAPITLAANSSSSAKTQTATR